MADLPNITQGTRWDDIPARQWRRLIDIVERVGDLHAQHPLQVIETGQGVRIQFDRPFDPVLPKTRRVVIVQEIKPLEDKTIVVRGVRYAAQAPPRGQRDDLIEQPDDRYEWTDKFEAYPDIGFVLDDYEGFVWSEERPGLEMVVLTARREHDVWLLEQPGGHGATHQFLLKSFTDGDYLVCHSWDGEIQGDQDILVAKSYRLRRSPWHFRLRGGISYIYSEDNLSRRATGAGGGLSEQQVIVPKFLFNEVIFATQGIVGGLTQVVVPEGTAAIKFLDDNRDARAWAKEFVQ